MQIEKRNGKGDDQISMRSARINSNRTIDEVADKMKISHDTVVMYENYAAAIPVSVALKMLNFYECHVDQVYFGPDDGDE